MTIEHCILTSYQSYFSTFFHRIAINIIIALSMIYFYWINKTKKYAVFFHLEISWRFDWGWEILERSIKYNMKVQLHLDWVERLFVFIFFLTYHVHSMNQQIIQMFKQNNTKYICFNNNKNTFSYFVVWLFSMFCKLQSIFAVTCSFENA